MRGGSSLRTHPPLPEDPLNIDVRPEPIAGARLVQDYLTGSGGARAFYPGPPFEVESFRRKLLEVQRRFGRPEREAAAAALRPLTARARERLQRFVDHGGAMITTGQQAGFLTGPLYTVYKALTVARLAEQLEPLLGVPVLPVFWTASEDHDWAEVNHAFLADSRGSTLRVDLPGDPAPALPMSHRTLDEGVGTVLDEVAQVIRGQLFEREVLEWIRAAYTPGRSVAQAFSEMLARLIEPFDFCMTDAADPAVKAVSAPVLERALREAEAHESILRERVRDLDAAGYRAQVSVLPGATNVFHQGEAGRLRLHVRGDRLAVRGGGPGTERAAVIDELRRDPSRFSPNVLLRPVVESTVFPTLAYVGGPGELAYFAQVNALFAAFDILPPVAYPRSSALLVEEPIERLLGTLGLRTPDLQRPEHELLQAMARRAVPAEVEAEIAALSAAVAEGYRLLIERVNESYPSLRAGLGRLRNEALRGVGEAEHRLLREVKRADSVTRARLGRVRALLWPDGQPQDRVLNVVPFLARHGPGLLTRIAAALEVPLSDAVAEGGPPRRVPA